jgi:YVTN family beta-propeller protein
MTISIWIPDSDLDTTSVTAYETDKSGVHINSKGLLNDAGLNGDATAGDKIYTLRFSVNDASPTTHYYAVFYKSLSTGAIYSTEVDTTASVPTVSATDSFSYAQNIEDSMTRIINGTSSYQSMLPTPSTTINQTALTSYISAMVSVMGNIQQLSSYDTKNSQAGHIYMSGERPAVTPFSTVSSTFWTSIASAIGLGDFLQTSTSLLSEKSAFLGSSFNPNDPAVVGIMAWLAQNPDYESSCSPDLADDTTCRAVIWPYYAASPSAGLLVATAKTAANVGISEYTGLAETGTGDLISNQPDLTPLEQWALTKDINAVIDYFADSFTSSSGRQMLILGNVASGQTTALPNGSHNILLATGTSQTEPSSSLAPAIYTLVPSSLVAGAASQTLTINGTNFLPSSTVTFNGVAHTSTYISTSQITIHLTSSDLVVSGSYLVVVTNPADVGTVSAGTTFWVTTGPSTATVPVGSYPVAIAVNAQTNKIYVANSSDKSVTVIDGTDNSTTTISVGYGPQAIAVNAVTNKIYVADGDEVTVIDGATNSTTSISLSFKATPDSQLDGLWGIAVNQLTNMIYAVDYWADTIVINGSDHSYSIISGAISGSANYPSVYVNPVTNQIYTIYDAQGGSYGNVSIIDGATLGKTTITAGKNPIALAVNPLTNEIYVANNWSGDVTIINDADYTTSTVTGGHDQVAIVVNPISNMFYIASTDGCSTYCSGGYTVIDGSNNSSSYSNISGSALSAVAINLVANKVYFANSTNSYNNIGNNTVIVFDEATKTTSSVTVGNKPSAIAVNPVTNKVYVVNSGSKTVTVIGPE